MPISVITPPTSEPLAVADAVSFCRALPADEALIQAFIRTARERAEHLTQRIFAKRTLEWSGGYQHLSWDARWDSGGPFYVYASGADLPGPVLSIESVEYFAQDGTDVVVDASRYRLEPALPAHLSFCFAEPRPATRPDAIRVRFVAGYEPETMPASLLQWMQIQVATYYAQREAFALGSKLEEMPRNFVDGLLDELIVSTRFV